MRWRLLWQGDAMNWVLEYNAKIQSGEIVASRRVKQQYAKLAGEIASPVRFIFDEERANRPIEFIEQFCRHSKGEWAGRALKLELFQKAFIGALFGFINPTTGLRRYRETMFYCARKNGKTSLLAGLALYMLLGDREGGAEVYCVASKKDQARLLFDETTNMVKQSPDLSRHVRKRKMDLYFGATMSKMQALGKNSDTLDGLNAHCVIMDELHAVKNRELYEVMKQSQSARRQPLMIMITTAGTVRENIFDDMYTYACNVVEGKFEDDAFLPILYELDSKTEWTEPAAWSKANPGLGAIKKLEDLQQKVARAKASPQDLTGVLCKDFNIRTTVSTAWLSFDDLNHEATFDLEQFRGGYFIGGCDLSLTLDLTCATILMLGKDGTRYVHQMYWLPRDTFLERVQKEKIPYDKWLERGLLRLCNGNTIDYSDVTAWFLEIVQQHGITPLWVYYDSYSARYFVEEMKDYGFRMERCIQGAKTLSLPMQQLGADLKAKRVNYNNHPILKWCLTNTGVETDRNGNIVPIKNQAAKMRIDGTASLLDAYVGLFAHYEEFKRLVAA